VSSDLFKEGSGAGINSAAGQFRVSGWFCGSLGGSLIIGSGVLVGFGGSQGSST
jgi:hypothetical protein